jgi:hypothetical protein
VQIRKFHNRREEKMKKAVMFLASCIVLVSFIASPVGAIPGDVSGNGSVGWEDILYLLDYLFRGGAAPPNPIDADVDGSPGINIGDVLQLTGSLFDGCSLLPYTGVSVKVSSQIRFSSDLILIEDENTRDTTLIEIIANGGPDITGMVIPLSFANQAGEMEVDLAEVKFDGSIVPSDWSRLYVIDNVNKTLLLYPYGDNTTDPPLTQGTTGLVATLYFDQVVAGNPVAMSVTEIPPSHQFMLISAYCADGTPPSERIFSPMLSLARNGDVNCDGIVNLTDAIYILNYLFKDGPPPCGM